MSKQWGKGRAGGVSPLLVRFYGLSVVVGLTLGLTAPLTAVFAVQLGANAFLAAASVASLTVVVLVMDIFGTRYLPHLEPRRAITIGMSLWAIGSFGTAVAPTFEVMVAARLVQGFGLAFHAGTAAQLAVKLTGPGRVGTGLGRFQAALSLGSAVAPLSGGAIAAIGSDQAGIRIAFAVCGVLALACAVIAWIVIPTTRSEHAPKFGWPRLPGMLRPKSLLALWAGSTGQGIRGAIALTVLPLVAVDGFRFSSVVLGALLTVMYLVEVVNMTVGGAISDRRGRLPVIVVAALAGVLGLAVVIVADMRDAPLLFLLAVVPLGLAGGTMLGTMPAALVDIGGTPEIGLSASRIARDLGFSAYTVAIGGAITLWGVNSALWLCGALYLAVALAMLVVGETRGGTAELRTAAA